MTVSITIIMQPNFVIYVTNFS